MSGFYRNDISTRGMFSSHKSARSRRVFLSICVVVSIYMLGVSSIFAGFELLPDDALHSSVQALLDQDNDEDVIQLDQSVQYMEETMRTNAQDLQNMQVKYADIIEHQEVAQQEYEYISTEVQKAQQDIDDRAVSMRIYQTKIKQLSSIKDEIATDLFALKRYVGVYSRVVLKQRQQGDDESILHTLISQQTGMDLGQEYLVDILISHLVQMLSELAKQEQQYYTHLQTLYEVASDFQAIDAKQRDRLAVLGVQLQSLEGLLSNLQSDRKTIQEYVQEVRRSEELMQQTILDLEQNLEDKKTFLESMSSQLINYSRPERSGRTYMLSRPTLYMGDLLFNVPRFIAYHGVSISVPQSKEIYAPAGSVVIDMYHSGDRSLSWVLLGHEDGSSTLMYPLSDIYIGVGDVVPRGTIIGLSGGEAGTPGSGRGSSESHLTIHVFRDGKVLDPLQELDISVWQDSSMLPAAYHDKYLSDADTRSVYVHDVSLISGNTVNARVSSYLARNAGPAFSDPQLWYGAAQGTGIDPLMGICIAAAETSWRNFASNNNIGNVGNNDRGDRVAYTSPSQAVRAIYQTLGNRYLGSYTQLSQFSRFGNKTGSIYASDPTNWQRNVQRCLVSLTHIYYDEEYFMRRVK